ncbi:hypothetical protein EJ08DRAFT_139789 [Tothia fuscella]|uniref:CID domain-containing protein n=1 Tax=Tothia fuscella TaxID=1048955 RepID=A0A9P4NU34_9PEZI|nr:hypothetical protein EJ08DRAFT_139789 [Tothia fuscella]
MTSHPALQELANLLQQLQSLKPPGVAKSKVEAITNICTSHDNLSIDRRTIVDTILAAFARSPATHKLGILYIVDSITRQWVAGGEVYATGVQKMTEVLPKMMVELYQELPENQKDKTSKLIDIWVNCKTFPADMLTSFKRWLTDLPAANGLPNQGTAPTNGHVAQQQQVHPPAPTANGYTNPGMRDAVENMNNVMARQAPTTAGASAPLPPPVSMQNAIPQGQPAMMPYAQPMAVAPQVTAAPQYASNPSVVAPASDNNFLATLQNAQGTVNSQGVNPQLALLQQLATQVSPEQFAGVIAALGIQLPVPAQSAPPPPVVAQQVAQPMQNGAYNGQNGHSHIQAPVREEQDYSMYQRERSRSPDFKRRRVSPPNRRESPTYGVYDPNQSEPSRQQDYDRGARGRGRGGRYRNDRSDRNEYRQRSPPRERPISPALLPPRGSVPKMIEHDYKLQAGWIKVRSRTLFIGGVKTNEEDLMNFMNRYARVQSCIVNHDKRHAFLKLITHQDAITAKASVDALPDNEYRHMFERINWAVGFGPTKYADYKAGESVLPINVLTDADLKWLVTAEFGGTGGIEVQQGMVVEEPDIEIGAGPSSKGLLLICASHSNCH